MKKAQHQINDNRHRQPDNQTASDPSASLVRGPFLACQSARLAKGGSEMEAKPLKETLLQSLRTPRPFQAKTYGIHRRFRRWSGFEVAAGQQKMLLIVSSCTGAL
eukprot:4365516-Amphidinium_carterae.1